MREFSFGNSDCVTVLLTYAPSICVSAHFSKGHCPNEVVVRYTYATTPSYAKRVLDSQEYNR